MTRQGWEKHSTEDCRLIAEAGTILRCEVGSGVHGIAVEGMDDTDEMGICIEPPGYVIGLKEFEQYVYRTQPEGQRSGPGDLDLIVYKLRKWMRLALEGNPTVSLLLFTPDSSVRTIDEIGKDLRANYHRIVSLNTGFCFLRYLDNQRRGMMGERSSHVTRPELEKKFGFDTKYACHAVRLGLQGIELMNTGKITIPMPENERQLVVDIKTGKFTKPQVLEMVNDLDSGLQRAITQSGLPRHPQSEWAQRFLANAYRRHWAW